jgi:hypothetical protein
MVEEVTDKQDMWQQVVTRYSKIMVWYDEVRLNAA